MPEVGYELYRLITVSGTGGGLNFILNLPPHINDVELSGKLAKSGIIAHPLFDYYLHQNHKQMIQLNGLVMGFACASRTDLEKCAMSLVEQIKGY